MRKKFNSRDLYNYDNEDLDFCGAYDGFYGRDMDEENHRASKKIRDQNRRSKRREKESNYDW